MIGRAVDELVRHRYTVLSNLYWQLRACRPWAQAMRRRWYRRIRAEKHRLLQDGVPPIEIHLWCRHFVDPRNENYRQRINGYYGENIASRFSVGVVWPISNDQQKCHQKQAQLERLKAKRSVNNVYYVKQYRSNAFTNWECSPLIRIRFPRVQASIWGKTTFFAKLAIFSGVHNSHVAKHLLIAGTSPLFGIRLQ